jgi:pimeloyl-ACP methyl ester carboxylesterase
MVGFIEPVGTLTQSAQADRKQHMSTTNANGPRYSRHTFFKTFMQTPIELASWTGRCAPRSVVLAVLLLALGVSRAEAACTEGTTTLAGVPAIVSVPKEVSKPPILLWHGFGPPVSESELQRALPLNDVPAVKVYLGLPLFGARAPAAGEKSLAERQKQDYGTQLFEPVVMGAANELPAVVKALRGRKCLGAREPIGLFGFSAGGAAVLFALAEHKVPVRAAVTINAPTGLNASIDAMERATKQPYAWTPATHTLAARSDAVSRAADLAAGHPPPALLVIHGADDTIVKPDGAIALRDALLPFYRSEPERLRLLIAPGVSHDWTKQDVRASVADWFNRYL